MKSKKVFKIVLLGEGAVGKTALRHRYLGQSFKADYSMTIGADFAVKRVELDGSEVVAQIWDLAGQVRFQTVRELYYQGSAGALIVFDITRPDTFQKVPNWIDELIKNNKSNKSKVVPMILIGNKGDLRETSSETILRETAEQYATDLSNWAELGVTYIETSAKHGKNVEEAFIALLRNIDNQKLVK